MHVSHEGGGSAKLIPVKPVCLCLVPSHLSTYLTAVQKEQRFDIIFKYIIHLYALYNVVFNIFASMFIFRAATWIFSGGLFLQQRWFLKCDGRAKLAGRAMSSPLSFKHYVCYIMSVHLCTDRSELSQTVWLILFLYTMTVGSPLSLVYQGHRRRLY